MPDVATRLDAALPMIVVCDDDTVDNLLRSAYLIRSHDHQQLLTGEDAIFGKDVKKGMFGKEGFGEVHQVGDGYILLVGPPRGELKRVVSVLALPGLGLATHLLDMGKAGGVAIIFCLRTVRDNEDLHVLEESGAAPERLALIAVDLVEGFADGHTTAL